MNNSYIRNDCRLCNQSKLKLVLKLEDSPLCDAYLKWKRDQEFYKLNLFRCSNCGFIQIDTVIDPEVIYKDYIYVTSSSQGLVDHFSSYSEDVLNNVEIQKESLIIDIGSNEGTLLNFFQKRGYKVLGIEPSSKAANIANSNGIETICDFFNLDKVDEIILKHGHASMITVNNLFANVDDLYNFTNAVEKLLDNNGVFVIESSYLYDMIDNMVFDFIYHEHLSYFSILPLASFFEQFNMHLVFVEKVNSKGGSMRYYWAKKSSNISPSSIVEKQLLIEKKYNLNENLFKDYSLKINNQKEILLKFLDGNSDENIVGYGASATSTTLITHFQCNEYFSYLVDDNIDKINTFSPGYHIPVYDTQKLYDDNIDIVVILAWRYSEMIIKNNDKFLKNGGKFIIPLPQFQIIEL